LDKNLKSFRKRLGFSRSFLIGESNMRKHAAGLTFFVSIVSLFAVGYAAFRTYPIPAVEDVEIAEGDPSKQFCLGYRGPHDVRAAQAIANPRNKSLAFSLSNGSDSITEVVFAFYNVNGDGVHFVRSEVVKIRPEQWRSGTANGVIEYESDWLGSKQITDNLYVVAGARRPERGSYEDLPFSRNNATAVLIAKN
jgi:hypothetical protein